LFEDRHIGSIPWSVVGDIYGVVEDFSWCECDFACFLGSGQVCAIVDGDVVTWYGVVFVVSSFVLERDVDDVFYYAIGEVFVDLDCNI